MISLIAFLGNTGREYEQTRHNAAWIIADRLALCRSISWQQKFRGLYGRVPAGYTGGRVVHVVKPETYMNLSGECVGAAASFFKIPADEVLVVHDELELAPAALSLKWAGGLAGHNGLRSVKAALGTADFWRLRLGIGRPDSPHTGVQPDIAGYVLSPFTMAEYNLLTETVPQLDTLFAELLTDDKPLASLLPKWAKVLPQA